MLLGCVTTLVSPAWEEIGCLDTSSVSTFERWARLSKGHGADTKHKSAKPSLDIKKFSREALNNLANPFVENRPVVLDRCSSLINT
ncbi:hypothetical protein C0Q70_12233 [Pomacea canaliculata]|uniref:Uncharacterized protein n=1 Tax=Pomacea canaliculata TaxID=400727 RepID=A0A2T7P0Z1_POMCA|nr:hypothetical protein C0Q70_12233 [Pomacea canaliculata]